MIFRSITVLILSAILFLSSCGVETVEEKLIGTWQMQKVFQEGDDVTGFHNPYSERKITFHEDYSFESSGRPYSRNTGMWEVDPKTNELFLDNDAEEGDDSYWIISFPEENLMVWKGTKSEFTKEFKINYRRTK